MNNEMLELAAKAAGYKKYYTHYLGRDSFVTYDDEYYSEVKKRRVVGEKTLDWNPHTDDGVALRLAVKLALLVGTFKFLRLLVNSLRQEKEKHNDPYTATRHALVRVAAEIGRKML